MCCAAVLDELVFGFYQPEISNINNINPSTIDYE